MVQHRAYKYRIYPTDEQAVKMQHNIDCSRFVYNQILSDRILYHDLYEEGEFTKQERDELQKSLTPGFYKNLTPEEAQEYYGRNFEFLKDTDCYALCNSQLDVESAYRNFYKGVTKYPKHKRRDSAKQSYTTNARYTKRKDGTIHASIYVKNSHIRLPKIGMVKINKHRPLYGHIKRVTITIDIGTMTNPRTGDTTISVVEVNPAVNSGYFQADPYPVMSALAHTWDTARKQCGDGWITWADIAPTTAARSARISRIVRNTTRVG